MTSRIFVAALVNALWVAAALQAAEPPANPIKPLAIDETRARNMVPVQYFATLGMKLTLQIGYRGAEDAPIAYGHWHLNRAVDELGDDLRPPPEPPPSTQPLTPATLEQALMEAHDEVGWNSSLTKLIASNVQAEKIGDHGNVAVECRLAPAPRRATKLTLLQGDVTLYMGRSMTATFDHAATRFGKPLDDPSLTAAGLHVELLPANEKPPENEMSFDGPRIRLRCRGNLHALQTFAFEVLGPDGKSMKEGFSKDPDPDSHDDVAEITLRRLLDEAMSIQIKVDVPTREVVVPVELHDLKLP